MRQIAFAFVVVNGGGGAAAAVPPPPIYVVLILLAYTHTHTHICVMCTLYTHINFVVTQNVCYFTYSLHNCAIFDC